MYGVSTGPINCLPYTSAMPSWPNPRGRGGVIMWYTYLNDAFMGIRQRLSPHWRQLILTVMRWLVIILSALLIVFISIDTFTHVDFMLSSGYMTFQLWVCVVYIADFFLELAFSPRRGEYARRHWLFLLLSIPYINLLSLTGIHLSPQALYFIRFIPLARAALAMSIVIGYVTSTKVGGMLASYVSIMVLITYFLSLIFLQCEGPHNPAIRTYWDSIWWCMLELTTVGAPVSPVTGIGKICAAALATMGMIMFPLFTVYLTTWVRNHWLEATEIHNA